MDFSKNSVHFCGRRDFQEKREERKEKKKGKIIKIPQEQAPPFLFVGAAACPARTNSIRRTGGAKAFSLGRRWPEGLTDVGR